jgi:hypothetical protein
MGGRGAELTRIAERSHGRGRAGGRSALRRLLAGRVRTWSNRGMSDASDDIEDRLATAAQALREREVTTQRCSDLRARQDELEAEVAALRQKYSAELTDVERLEGMSLSRMLAPHVSGAQERDPSTS